MPSRMSAMRHDPHWGHFPGFFLDLTMLIKKAA
jgi:hypothetical protein